MIELLVVVAVTALLAAAVLPLVVRQTRVGDRAHWRSDLESVAQAAKLYRVDVRRWPRAVTQLLARPAAGDSDLNGSTLATGPVGRWRGPYLANFAGAADGAGFRSAGGSAVRDSFTVVPWRGGQYLQVQVANVPEEEARILSRAIDGDTVVGVPALTAEREEAGRVRFFPTAGGSGLGSLLFLAARADP